MSIKEVKQLKIAALHYTVERRPIPITESEFSNVIGKFCHESCKLLIANILADEVEALTIMHEAMHAFFHHANIHQDETNVEVMGNYMLNFIRDNPDFIKAVQSTRYHKE